MSRSLHRRGGGRHQEGGIVLIVAIVALLAMTIAAYALLRSVGSGLGIAGNIAFKQNATSTADMGIERAAQYLTSAAVAATPTVLENNVPEQAYFATWQAGFDPQTYAWEDPNNSREVVFPGGATDELGNSVRYVIHRLCSVPGSMTVANQGCVTPISKCVNEVGTGQSLGNCASQPFFRVTARVQGPRNTVSYIQVVMY